MLCAYLDCCQYVVGTSWEKLVNSVVITRAYSTNCDEVAWRRRVICRRRKRKLKLCYLLLLRYSKCLLKGMNDSFFFFVFVFLFILFFSIERSWARREPRKKHFCLRFKSWFWRANPSHSSFCIRRPVVLFNINICYVINRNVGLTFWGGFS